MYPSYKLHFLASLVRKHKRNKRQSKDKPAKPRGLQVIYYKQTKKSGVDPELIVQFFSACFNPGAEEVEKEFETMMNSLVESASTHTMVVVVDSNLDDKIHIIH